MSRENFQQGVLFFVLGGFLSAKIWRWVGWHACTHYFSNFYTLLTLMKTEWRYKWGRNRNSKGQRTSSYYIFIFKDLYYVEKKHGVHRTGDEAFKLWMPSPTHCRIQRVFRSHYPPSPALLPGANNCSPWHKYIIAKQPVWTLRKSIYFLTPFSCPQKIWSSYI